jgi:hypothetical protein
LNLTAEAVTSKEMRLRLTGSAQGGAYLFHGVLEGDRKNKTLTRFDAMWFSEAGHMDTGYMMKPTGTYSPMVHTFELSTGTAREDRLYPSAFTLNWRAEPTPARQAYLGTGD